MAHSIVWQSVPSSARAERYTPEALLRIGGRVGTVLSRQSSLQVYKRSIERQLALIAAHMHAEDILLLLLELRGSGGVSAPLEQIARILGEVGYWTPSTHAQDYRKPDVYYLGRSAQQLFDDYAVLDSRVKELHVHLERIKEDRRMEPETSPQEVFAVLAAASDGANAQTGVDAVVELLGQTAHAGWFRWLFEHGSRKKKQQALC